jgi:hypothetical protein
VLKEEIEEIGLLEVTVITAPCALPRRGSLETIKWRACMDSNPEPRDYESSLNIVSC